ncbi:MAG: hypothetical protein J5950_08050 [Clostridia bacterium]|nr:hypothetical protein [Clostridia bacterium]
MKNYKNLLKLCFVVLVAGILIVAGIYLLFAKRPTESESEKRKLTQMPELSFSSLLTGKYFSGLQAYYDDTIPGREEYKEISANMLSKMRGLPLNNLVIYNPVIIRATDEPDDPDEEGTFVPRPITTPVPFIDDDPTPAPTDEPEETAQITEQPSDIPTEEPTEPAGTETPATETQEPAKTPDPTATPAPTPVTTPTPTKTPSPTPTPAQPTKTPDQGGEPQIVEYPKDGAILYGDRGMELYGGSKSAMKRYVAAMEYIKDRCPDVNVYSMTVPLSSMFYLPPSYRSNATEQLNDLNYLEGLFSSKVTVVRVYDTIKSHVDAGENMYLRTDHHWTHLGAYYAMKEFARVAGVPFDDLSAYETHTRDGFVGSFYSYFGMKELKSKPETFTYYISQRNVTVNYYDAGNFSKTGHTGAYWLDVKLSESYSIAMGYDNLLSISKTDAGTGRRLLIIKDSFGNPTPSFLFGSFDRIIMIDPRYYTMDVYDLIQSQGITDVLGLANIFDHTTSGFVKLYEYVAQNR